MVLWLTFEWVKWIKWHIIIIIDDNWIQAKMIILIYVWMSRTRRMLPSIHKHKQISMAIILITLLMINVRLTVNTIKKKTNVFFCFFLFLRGESIDLFWSICQLTTRKGRCARKKFIWFEILLSAFCRLIQTNCNFKCNFLYLWFFFFSIRLHDFAHFIYYF